MMMINENDDDQMKLPLKKRSYARMACSKPNASSSSSTTSTMTQDHVEENATNNPNKLCYILKNSTTTLKIFLSKPLERLDDDDHGALNKNEQPMMNNMDEKKKSNSNNGDAGEIIDAVVPPPSKKMRTIVKMSSIVEQDGPNIITSMIDHVKNTIKGYDKGAISDAKIIMERKLNNTDIAGAQGRLAIPKGMILAEFLTDQEALFLSLKVNAINMTTMDVKVIIGSNKYDMSLSRWNYKNGDGFRYVLKNKKGQWTKIKQDHSLDVDHMILVATFRYNNVLHFAIHKKRSTMLFGKKVEQYRM